MPEPSGRSAGVLWLVVLRFVIIFLQIISLPISIHILGESLYGIAVYVGVIRLLWNFVDLDIPQGLIQVLSRTFRVDEERAWRYFRAGLFLQFLVGIVGAIGLFLAPWYLSGDKQLANTPGVSLLFMLAGLQFFFDSYGSTYNAPFNAREQFAKVAALTSIIPAIAIVLTIILVLVWRSPAAILLGTLIDSSLQTAVKIWYIVKKEKNFPILPKFDKESCQEILRISLKSYVAGLSSRIAGTADKAIVGAVLSKEMLAIYNVACRIPQILLEAFGKIAESITPEMTHVSANEPHRLAAIFRRNFRFMGFIAAVGIIFISGFGNVIQQAWLSKHYDNFGLLVFLMGIYYGLELHHSTITRVFFAQGKPHLMLPFTLWNSGITLLCTKYLALQYGLIGVATMNCFIDVAQIVPIHYYCSRFGVKDISLGQLLKITGIVVGLGVVLSFCAMMLTSQFKTDRWTAFAIVATIPFQCLALAFVFKKVGIIEFPEGLQRILRRKKA